MKEGKGYPDNTKEWQVGDLVIHKADAKRDWMLMCVVGTTDRTSFSGIKLRHAHYQFKTRYIMPGYIWDQHRNAPVGEMPPHARKHYCKEWRNEMSNLLDPADFDIEIPETHDKYWEGV